MHAVKPEIFFPALALALASMCLGPENRSEAAPGLPLIPYVLPEPMSDGSIWLEDGQGQKRPTTLNPDLTNALNAFIVESNKPIAAAVVLNARDGSVLAMAQGRQPQDWGGRSHTALHQGFPAASLFKTVVTAAAFETAHLDPELEESLSGGCSHVRETGDFLNDDERPHRGNTPMSLRRAFGTSCNGYFAKVAINHLGLGAITHFAKRLGWESGVPADFHIDRSPFLAPSPHNSSAYTVGRFAAGFGYVGMSAVHAAWLMLVIANDGLAMPLRLFKDTPMTKPSDVRLIAASTAKRLKEVMDSTVRGGTASSAFNKGKYKRLREIVGGKTGTLTGSSPKGVTTLFTGMAPIDQPEIIVATIALIENHWRFKASHLAAEAVLRYYELKEHTQAERRKKGGVVAAYPTGSKARRRVR